MPDRGCAFWEREVGAVSRALQPRVRACNIDRLPPRKERPSDHAPVVVEIG
jgi:exodeoxyribonuclease-3